MSVNRERALAVRTVQALARLDGGQISPAVGVFETEDAFLVAADMPGAEKGSIQVCAQAGSLTIRSAVAESFLGHAPHQRRTYFRQFVLTDGIDYGKASAEFADGVLTVRLPKDTDTKRWDIQIRGDDAI
jgi:HSP20 family protein